MKYIFYLFLATSLLLIGYEAVKYGRDMVRVASLNTLNSCIQLYDVKHGVFPPSDGEKSLSEILIQEKCLDKEVRDPILTSSTVLMDDMVKKILRIAVWGRDFLPSDLKGNLTALKAEVENERNPELVLLYVNGGKTYELSSKLESRFSQSKMREDGGNDDSRYEMGIEVKTLDTSLKRSGSDVVPNNPRVSVMR